MKKIISKTLALVTICIALFSFAPKPGGEGFEIFLNNKLLVQRFGSQINNASTLQLSSATATDQLVVKYYHCGKIGKNRTITIKDDQNRVLKEFKFIDESTSSVSVPLKDVINLKKGNTVLKLYYSSSELPNARMLVSINTQKQTV